MKTKQGARSAEQSALSFRDQARLHRRAATVANEIVLIDDILRGTTLEWMQAASREDQMTVVRDMKQRDHEGFALEFALACQPIRGGAR